MINIPNYREFYQMALIPMNDYDQQHFCKEFCRDQENCIKANHWLIAVEGNPGKINNEIYEWKVVVYPAKETGVFWSLKFPYYKSSSPQTLSQAIEESKGIIKNLKEQKLSAKTLQAC